MTEIDTGESGKVRASKQSYAAKPRSANVINSAPTAKQPKVEPVANKPVIAASDTLQANLARMQEFVKGGSKETELRRNAVEEAKARYSRLTAERPPFPTEASKVIQEMERMKAEKAESEQFLENYRRLTEVRVADLPLNDAGKLTDNAAEAIARQLVSSKAFY